jgi:DNA-binding protein YbaB
MSSPHAQAVAEMLGQLAEHSDRLRRARSFLEAQRATATSNDHMVSVTVDSRGDIAELKFHTTRYRSMAPAELAAAVTGVIAEARAQMAELVAETLAPLAPRGLSPADRLPGGNGELERMRDELAAARASWRPRGEGSM